MKVLKTHKKSHEGLGSNKKNQILDDTKLLSIVCVCVCVIVVLWLYSTIHSFEMYVEMFGVNCHDFSNLLSYNR